MRITLLSFDFPEYCIRHANEMALDNDVLLMLPENQLNGCESMVASSVRFEPFYKPRFRQPIEQLRTISKILRTVRQFKPDVVHFQHGHLYFNAVLPLLKRYPLVVTIHDPRQHVGDKDSRKVPQWLMDFGFRSAHRNIVHGSELIDTVHKIIGIPKEQIHYVPHIAIGKAAVESLNQERGLNVLFFGRIWEYKGLDYLIEAEPIVTQRFPEVRFVIGGQGEDFDRYRKKMVHPDRFEVYNEWISDEQRARMFSEASVVVLPYVEATQSGVVPIAYNFRKPVIATRVGALPEAVEHEKTGLLVPPRDATELAKAISTLLESPEKREAMGTAGQAKLRRECEASVVVAKTLEVYRQAIEDRRSRQTTRKSFISVGGLWL
jgi:glycosyltransferase involved in cell wall biosynthesis